MDDKELVRITKTISGGINNRQHGSIIKEDQVTVLENVDIGVPGESRKRPGLTLVEDLGNDAGLALFGFNPDGGTNELIACHGTKLEGWIGSGSFTEHKTDFASSSEVTLLKAGEEGENDVLLAKFSGSNWFRMNQSHTFQDLGSTSGTGSDSPPDSQVALYYRNRLWILKSNHLYWPSPFPADYSSAFNTTVDAYRIPVGTERFLLGIRDQGIIVGGEDAIWAVNPSATPAGTDKPEKLVDEGCVAGKTAVQVGDDILYLSRDGVRGLFRTKEDKVQTGNSFPISYALKSEVDSINWEYVEKACAIFFDNKYFISLPVDSGTYNNEVWVYYPAYNAWMVITGWNVAAWGKLRVNGEERLYAMDSADGKVYQAWSGYDDNGTAIAYKEEGRKEDMGLPLQLKSGGEYKIKALSTGDYTLDVYYSKDDEAYQLLGTMTLGGNAPTLPVTLPFTLADANVIQGIFHLDGIGEWNQLRIKIEHDDLNPNDEIKILERALVTYAQDYVPE